jgi:hypothetical protein
MMPIAVGVLRLTERLDLDYGFSPSRRFETY